MTVHVLVSGLPQGIPEAKDELVEAGCQDSLLFGLQSELLSDQDLDLCHPA